MFSRDEWDTLQFATLWLLVAVGLADGKLDRQEELAFHEYGAAAAVLAGGLTSEVFRAVATNRDAVMDAWSSDMETRTPEQAIRDAASLVDHKAPLHEAILYKLALLDLGASIALASGRLLGPKVARSERREINRISGWLNVDTVASEVLAPDHDVKVPRDARQTATSRADATIRGRYFLFHAGMSPQEIIQHFRMVGTPVSADEIAELVRSHVQLLEDLPPEEGHLRLPNRMRARWSRRLRRSDRRHAESPDGERADEPGFVSPVGRHLVESTFATMRVDDEWSVWDARGFSWWADSLRQRIEASAPIHSHGVDVTVVTASTDLLGGITDGASAIEAANAINMSAGMSAVIVDPQDGRSCLASSVVVHPGTLHYSRLFSVAAAYQVAEAHSLAQTFAESLGGHPDASAHPTEGQRAIPDEMIRVLDDIPMRDDLVPIGQDGFEEALAAVPTPGGQALFALGSVSKHGLTAEFPFYHATPAMYLDVRDPQAYLGTALLTLSVRDREADVYWASGGGGVGTPPNTDRHTGAVIRYGSGLYVRVGLPVELDELEAMSLAAELNRLESDGTSPNHLVGSWYAESGGLWFTAYHPNLLVAPLSAEQRITYLVNIVGSQAARIAWSRSFLSDRIPDPETRGERR